MRIVNGLLITFMALFGAFAQASAAYDTEKIKTGILPSGDFFGIYEVNCPDQVTAEIASLKGKRRWCAASYDGGVSCFQRKQAASLKACLSGAVAVSEETLESAKKHQ